jgi:hypothetical protein
MAYTYDDYIKDCYVAKQGDSNMAMDAKIRKNFYERGNANYIPLTYEQYCDSAEEYEYCKQWSKNKRKSNDLGGLLANLLYVFVIGIMPIVIVAFIVYNLLW